jgi:hypothetical protein
VSDDHIVRGGFGPAERDTILDRFTEGDRNELGRIGVADSLSSVAQAIWKYENAEMQRHSSEFEDQAGQGRPPDRENYLLAMRLVLLFEECTGRPAGVTWGPGKRRYSGDFFALCGIVSGILRIRPSEVGKKAHRFPTGNALGYYLRKYFPAGSNRIPQAPVDSSAMKMLDLKAEELCKADPSLNKEVAFAKVYTDPANRELVETEKRERLAKAAGGPRGNWLLG